MFKPFTSLALCASASALLLGCPKKDEAQATPAASAAVSAAPSAAASAPAAKAAEPPFEQRVAMTKPLDIKPEEQTIPGGKVSAEVCAVDGGPLVAKSGMDAYRAIRAIGDRVFVVTGEDDKIHAYKVAPGAPCKLTVDKTWGGDGVEALSKVEALAKDDAGNLWASTGVFGAKRYDKDGKESGKCESRPLGYLFVDPAGKNGIGTFANATVAKVTLAPDGTCKTEPWAFVDLGQDGKRKGPFTNAQAVGFVGDTIYMGAVVAKDQPGGGATVVAALDAKGTEKFRLGKTEQGSSEDRFGWVHGIAACKVGVCVLDSNYRRLTMWKGKEFVAAVNLSKLFNLKYPWINSFDLDKAGNAWFIAGQDREGAKGVAEANVYRVKGI